MLSEIYLIRHATADRDPAIPYHTPPGPSLSERGRFEARETATYLSGRGVRHLYVSPFRRTQETAEAIAELLGLPVTLRSLIAEAPPAEPAADVQARVGSFLDTLLAVPYPTVGVVSHGTPLLVLRATLCGEPVDLRPSQHGEPPLPAAAIWRLWRDGESWRADLAFAPSARPTLVL